MSELTELQEHLNYLKEVIALGDQVKRLKINKDFEELITQGFCIKEMQRYMGLAVSEKSTADLRTLCENSAKAGSVLMNYLDYLEKRAMIASHEIEEVQQAITELEVKGEEE